MSQDHASMKSTRQFPLAEIARQLSQHLTERLGTGLVSQIHRGSGASEVYMLIFECMYFRSMSSASLSVLLTQDGDMQLADLVGSGGGTGIFNVSLGANSDFVKTAAHILGDLGFTLLSDMG